VANRRQLYKYKGDCCAQCGKSVEEILEQFGQFERVFEFNHIDPSNKDPDYDNLIRRVISTKQLHEVDKCILLCRNCHGILHAQGITATLCLTVTAGGRKESQTFNGQMIMNWRDKAGTFFTCDRALVIPYWVYIGSKRPRLMFGKDLDDGFLSRQLAQLDKIKKLAIHSYDGHCLMRASPEEGGTFRLEWRVGFHLMTAELGGDTPESVTMWVRNGTALTKDGRVMKDGIITCYGGQPLAGDTSNSSVLDRASPACDNQEP
jgi:hypothetical protein